MQKKAVFPGSFDPPTKGHLDVILQAAGLFDTLYVCVIENPGKKSLFSPASRKELLKAMTAALENVVVEHAAGLTAAYAASRGAGYLVRGLRNPQDFSYETPLAYGNRSLESGLSTVFFLPEAGHAFISSALVREVITAGGVEKALVFVPDALHELMLNGGHAEERE